jgi:hypothetical protein
MAAYTSAGTTFALSDDVPATFNQAGYEAVGVVYSAVGEITDLGEFGREYALVTHNPVGNRSTQKFKASFNEGAMSMTLALDTDDTGQILMKTASGTDANYTCRVITQNGDKYYFQAKVMSFKVAVGSVDQITTATATLEITTTSTGVGIIEVLA